MWDGECVRVQSALLPTAILLKCQWHLGLAFARSIPLSPFCHFAPSLNSTSIILGLLFAQSVPFAAISGGSFCDFIGNFILGFNYLLNRFHLLVFHMDVLFKATIQRGKFLWLHFSFSSYAFIRSINRFFICRLLVKRFSLNSADVDLGLFFSQLVTFAIISRSIFLWLECIVAELWKGCTFSFN